MQFYLVVLALSLIPSTASTSSPPPPPPPTFVPKPAATTASSMGQKPSQPKSAKAASNVPKSASTSSTASASVAQQEESAVLRELKETVQKQAKELEILRAQVKESPAAKKPAAAASSHHGHGAPSDDSADELAAYVTKPFYSLAFKRVGWLSFFLSSLSLTALIMNGFEHTLQRQLELAYFVPLLAGHGGNTGGQTVGTVLSAMSAGSVTQKDAVGVITKEALSGMMVGAILGAMVGPVAHFGMGISYHVSTVIFLTLPLVSTIAATLGSAIPFACVAMGLDPSVIAAPAMTSFVDVSGLMAYFLIANQVFAMFGIEL